MTSPLNTDPDKEVCEAVQHCIKVFGKTELADEFEVSQSTIDRWANGVAKPMPKFRALVLAYIKDLDFPEEP